MSAWEYSLKSWRFDGGRAKGWSDQELADQEKRDAFADWLTAQDSAGWQLVRIADAPMGWPVLNREVLLRRPRH